MAASLTLRVVSAPPTERAPPPFTLAGGRATIGRRDGNSWVLPDASAGVSREHAVIEGAQGGWQIVDKSANGTFVNGQNVGNGNAWPLGPGDSIRIGGYEIAVEMEGGQDDFGRAAAGPPTIGNDSFDLGDLARADFGAPRAAPRGPSPLDPMAEERPPELPASNDLFGELGDNRTPLSPGGAMADPFNAPEQRGLGAPPPDASPFGAPSPSSGSPFGGPLPDNWGTPQSGNPDPFAAPAPPPQRSAFTNAPDPLAALPDPFDQPPAAPDDRHVPMPQSPFALQPVAIPNPVGPGPQQALPTDWDATPSGGLSAPPAELDPIEAALAGLAPKTGSSQPVAPDPGLDRAFGMPPGPVPGPTPPQPAAARPRPQAPTPRPAPPPPLAPPQHRPPVSSPAPAPRAMAPVAPPVDDWVDVPQAPPVGDNLFGDANAGQPAPGPVNAMQSPPIPTDDPFDGPSDRQPSGRISVSKVVFPPPGVPAAPVPAKPTPVAAPTPAPPPPPQRRAAPTPQPSAAPELGGDELLRAFLDGAGIENLPPNTDAATALRTLGASTRAIVSTLARLLEARRLLKGEFRISQTVVAARENNPLKFSADESEMLLVMLGSVRPGFQSGQAAVWDAGKDLEAHQLALLAAFRAVLDAVLARLSPEAIAGAGGEEAGMFGRLLQAREAGYWQRYTKAYGEVKQDIGNTLAGRIGQIFAEAYERENSKKGGSR
jgi:FHA domain-containing protein